MIRYVQQAYLDQAKYDLCIQRHEHALPYGERWYLDGACQQWDCLVLNDYDAVWPLPFRQKWGIKYAYRPYGIQQLGIFSKKVLAAKEEQAFYQSLSQQFRFSELYLNHGQRPALAQAPKLRLQESANYMVDIKRPYESVYEHYSQNLRRKLKKAEQNKLQLFENDGPDVLLGLFREHKGKSLQLSEDFYRDMKKILYLGLHKGIAKILTVYGGPNMLLGGAYFLQYRGRAVFLFSALAPEGRELHVMPYLINEYLIFHSGQMEWLDFEGSNDPGLARFYQSFGAQNYPYYAWRYNALPWPLSLLKS